MPQEVCYKFDMQSPEGERDDSLASGRFQSKLA